jgi:Na+/phosphate symporter
MKPESESETKAAITELIEAGVADKATLVLLRATQEILRELDEIKATVSEFKSALDWNDQHILDLMDRGVMDAWLARRGRRR